MQASSTSHQSIYLTGRPALKSFLNFIRQNAIEPPPEGTLTEEWNAARDYICELEKTEAGAADDPAITKLSPEAEPLLIELLKDPLVRNGFNTVPTEIAVVELDKLVVHQREIDITFAHELQEKLGAHPSAEEIFRMCLPFDHPCPPVKWSQTRHDQFVILSPSTDLRFLGPMKLQPENIQGYPPPGNLAAVLGLALGFGCNFLCAVYVENRLILNNGSHRAYALRAMGITHVPCIIEHVSHREELNVVGASEVRHNADLYLKAPRPPMLKDYFHPQLHKVIDVQRQLRQIAVKFEVEETYLPAF